jgi:hypothetical protein
MRLMNTAQLSSYTAFAGMQRIAAGELPAVVAVVKPYIDKGAEQNILIFDDFTSESIGVDFRGSLSVVFSRLPKAAVPEVEAPAVEAVARTAGRPKLGVVPREVTLLPRHWEWLATQPGGASVALRKLVESASRANETKDRIRQAQEAAYRFMSTMAGNLPGYEEAVRTLFADKPEQFGLHTEAWPADVRDHARMIALRAFTV